MFISVKMDSGNSDVKMGNTYWCKGGQWILL